MKEIGIYIHIPFCVQKCYYCDFVSYTNKDCIIPKYVQAVKNEILNFIQKNKDIKISTMYIGGGTPSYIASKYIKEIMDLLNEQKILENTKEITIEVNPKTANIEKLEEYKKMGINRLSIGLQSTENRLLEQIGRIHNYQDFLDTYNMAKKVGFKNINVDLMIGLPNQNLKDVKKSVEELIKLNPQHISVYSLIVEENTPIYKILETGKIKLPDEELERNMYWYVKNKLELNGFKHYEISNFAKEGYESKHNMDCWSQKEYIGFGVAAYSYIDDVRFGNIDNIEKFIENCLNNKFEENKIIEEIEDNILNKEKEYMLIGLRKIDGISIQEFKNKFGENPIFVFKNELNKLVEEKLIKIDYDKIFLSNKGLDLANIVWEEFI